MAKLTAGHVRAALQKAYGPPESVIFFEVANATGAAARRWADAVSMGCWPSRGLLIHGFEIKVSKYDWRREKDTPQKAEAVAAYCDLWSVVTVDGVIGDDSEVPASWGWLVVDANGKIKTMRQPQKLTPKPLDRTFVASLLRSAGTTDQSAIDAAIHAGVRERTKSVEESFERRLQQRVEHATQDLAEKVRRYERANEILGPSVSRYLDDAEFIGAVRLVLSLGVTRSYSGMRSLRDQLRRMSDTFDAAAADLGLPSQAELFEMDERARPRPTNGRDRSAGDRVRR